MIIQALHSTYNTQKSTHKHPHTRTLENQAAKRTTACTKACFLNLVFGQVNPASLPFALVSRKPCVTSRVCVWVCVALPTLAFFPASTARFPKFLGSNPPGTARGKNAMESTKLAAAQ